MKKNIFFFSLIIVFSFFLFSIRKNEVLADELSDLQNKISEYERQINELEKQSISLSQQISLMDNQIKVAALKISQSQAQIKSLEQEIVTLSGKIVRLDGSLNYLSKVLLSRVAETYKKGKFDAFVLLVSSKNFSEFISQYRYLQAVQFHDRQLLLSMEQTRTSYDEQKQLKEKLQADLVKLQEKLIAQKQQLATQVEDRKKLLEETKGKETEYQRLLAVALSEQETILKSMQAAILKLADGTKVEKGKEIALIGNTGYPCCSTGTHLHFMVTTGCQRDDKGYIKDCNPVNPADYLKNVTVNYDKDVGQMSFRGDWDWPVENPRITQEYGMSWWARTGYYGGKPHDGIDMVNTSYVIKAPRDGILYRNSTRCCSNNRACRDIGGCANVNFIVLDHGGGVYSWYWHVQ